MSNRVLILSYAAYAMNGSGIYYTLCIIKLFLFPLFIP